MLAEPRADGTYRYTLSFLYEDRPYQILFDYYKDDRSELIAQDPAVGVAAFRELLNHPRPIFECSSEWEVEQENDGSWLFISRVWN
jgi:hypothetical protein